MARSKLFNRLVVNVVGQRTQNRGIVVPKSGSNGLVACFNEEAAQLLVTLLNPLPKDGLITGEWGIEWLLRQWKLHGMPGVQMKDLRRASLYWPGHEGGLGFAELKNHARHSRAETTALYIRRPEECVEEGGGDLCL